ncbi:hypothetical protein GBF38_015462 [Nibea albiflora]|uniref:Uncharacterized protein n=1 Tax=Nibea albiflora TaxID=240163 RepID=A0ACB7EMK5_NIBAL|nr:hypothetical protein GBF38_015462 [Nibea albiflora]
MNRAEEEEEEEEEEEDEEEERASCCTGGQPGCGGSEPEKAEERALLLEDAAGIYSFVRCVSKDYHRGGGEGGGRPGRAAVRRALHSG